MAYWCPQRVAVELVSATSLLRHTLEQPYALIGSCAGSDIRLASDEIDPRGYYLHATSSGLWCVDLRRSSAAPASQARVLSRTETVNAGAFSFTAWGEEPAWAAGVNLPGLPAGDSESNVVPELRVYYKSRCLGRRKLRRPLTLAGRWANCELRLQGPRVSGVHCSLYWQDGRLWCVDLGSSNGVIVQGQQHSCVEIAIGGLVRIGDFEVAFDRLVRRRDKRPLPASLAANADPAPLASLAPTSATAAAHRLHLPLAPVISGRCPPSLTLELNQIRVEFARRADDAPESAVTRLEAIAHSELASGAAALPPVVVRPKLPAGSSARLAAKRPAIACGAPDGEPKWPLRTKAPAVRRAVENNASIPTASPRILDPGPSPVVEPYEVQHMKGPMTTCEAPANSAPDALGLDCAAEENRCEREAAAAQQSDAAHSLVMTVAGERDLIVAEPSIDGLAAAPPSRELACVDEKTGGIATLARSRRVSPPVRVARDELVEYVTDRIVGLERKRNRRRVWIGAGAALSLAVTLVAAGGVWLHFGQEYLPLPPSMLQQLPEPIAAWLLSIGVSP